MRTRARQDLLESVLEPREQPLLVQGRRVGRLVRACPVVGHELDMGSVLAFVPLPNLAARDNEHQGSCHSSDPAHPVFRGMQGRRCSQIAHAELRKRSPRSRADALAARTLLRK